MAQSMAKTTPVMAPVAASKKVALRPATSRTAPKFTPVPQTGKMMVWQPINNKQFELFSYMPPFSVDEVVKQLDYIIRNGWTPCLEFAQPDAAYPTMIYGNRMGNGVCSGYYDNRYYTMWKLPMYGCTDPSQILRELAEVEKCYPDAYIRLAAFDNIRQVQLVGFLLRRPPNATEYCPIDKRSISVDTIGK